MKQYNRSGMNAGKQFVKGFFMSRLIILLPVYIGKAPEKCLVSQLLCHFQIFSTVDTLWGTVIFDHVSAGDFFIERFYAGKFFLKIFDRGNLRHIRMTERMIGHCMPFFCHAADQIRIIPDKVSHNKESSRSLMFFQRI